MSPTLAPATRAPENCIWTKQIMSTLQWFQAFLQEEVGEISRTFEFDNLFGHALFMEITCDASPWGLGGWLSVNNKPISFFYDAITPDDERILNHQIGSNLGQQAFESLALLVAHRLWLKLVRGRRVKLNVRSDNLGALHTYAALKGKGQGMNLISREFALDAGKCELTPDLITHLPGVANGISDVLSRKFDPRYAKDLQTPTFLANSTQVTPPRRSDEWWRARVAPGSAKPGNWGRQS